MNIAGNILIIVGGAFLMLAGLGILRMPDVYNRLQAGTKASTLGTICTIFGVILIRPEWWFELVLIMILVLLGAPVASSVLAKAVHNKKELKAKLIKDEMEE